MIVAPRSPSIVEQKGPGTLTVRSITVIWLKGFSIVRSYLGYFCRDWSFGTENNGYRFPY